MTSLSSLGMEKTEGCFARSFGYPFSIDIFYFSAYVCMCVCVSYSFCLRKPNLNPSALKTHPLTSRIHRQDLNNQTRFGLCSFTYQHRCNGTHTATQCAYINSEGRLQNPPHILLSPLSLSELRSPIWLENNPFLILIILQIYIIKSPIDLLLWKCLSKRKKLGMEVAPKG